MRKFPRIGINSELELARPERFNMVNRASRVKGEGNSGGLFLGDESVANGLCLEGENRKEKCLKRIS